MKRLLIYTAIGIGTLAALFIILVLGVAAIANNENDRQNYAYVVGYAFAILMMVVAGGVIIFGLFKLTMTIFFKRDDPQEETVLDKDGPIDRYLK